MLKNGLFSILLFLIGTQLHANTITVDSTNNAGVGSLRLAISTAVDGDTIRFNPNLINIGSDSIVLDSSIVFSKSLTLIGLYNLTDTLFLSGGYTNRIFYVDSTTYISLDSMVLIHADTAALEMWFVDSVVFNHSIFENNPGIGAYLQYSTFLKVNECVFQGNAGGGISAGLGNYPHLSKMTHITNSQFLYNNYTGLSITARDSLPITISNCQFIGNNRMNNFRGGGGIYFYSGWINAEIKDSQIIQNTANEGGGVYLKTFHFAAQRPTSQILKLFNTTINSNTAQRAGGGIYTEFYDNGAEITRNIHLSHSSINNNTVTNSLGQGGALYSKFDGRGSFGSPVYLNNSINIEQTTISGNTSPYQGGAIYSQSYVPSTANTNSINIKNSTLTNNTSNSGGGVFIDTNIHVGSLSPTLLNIISSIVALNGNSNIYHYQVPFIVSGGYNIFSESLLAGSIGTDLLNVDSTALNLTPLAFNGGPTQTITPMIPSIAKDNGNPNDSTNAQNSPIFGIRDIGAAEVPYSFHLDTIVACIEFTWANDTTFYEDAIVKDTLISTLGTDSVVTLDLTIHHVDTAVISTNLTLIAQASSANFQWINCEDNSPFPDSTFASFTVNLSGSYAVEVIQNGCVDTSNCVTFTNVGILENATKTSISIYPNPAKELIRFDITSPFSVHNYALKLYDVMGRLVLVENLESHENSVSVAHLKPGVYTYQVGGNWGSLVVE